MITEFNGKQITSMLAVLPETVGFFDDEVDNYSFPPKQTLRLKKVMGYDQHRLAKERCPTNANRGNLSARLRLTAI